MECENIKSKSYNIEFAHLKNIKAWEGSGAMDNVGGNLSVGATSLDFQITGAENPFGYISHTDTSLKFQIAYMYDVDSAFDFFKYFIPSIAKKQVLNIPIQSCHKSKFPITFHVYPDIKWTFKIAFNCDRLKVPQIETTLKNKNEYISTVVPIPDAVLHYIGKRDHFEQKVILGEKFTCSNIDFSLAAQLDQEDDDHYSTEVSVSGAVKTKIAKELESLGKLGETIQALFDGESVEGNEEKHDEDKEGKKITKKDKKKLKKKLNKFTDDSIEEYIEGDKSKKGLKKDTKKLRKKLKEKGLTVPIRKLIEPTINWPSIGMAFSWSLSEGKTETARQRELLHKTGYKLEAAVSAEPLIGMAAKLDFIGLISRAHPIATAVVLLIDALSALADVTVDLYFEIEGNLSCEVNGFLDTLTGENTFNRHSLVETNEKLAKMVGQLKFTLGGAVTMNKEFQVFSYKASIEGEASITAEAEAKIGLALHADQKGFYLQPVFTFEGLTIIGKANVKVDFKEEETNYEEDDDGGDGQSGELSYQVIDRTITKLTPIKLYKDMDTDKKGK